MRCMLPAVCFTAYMRRNCSHSLTLCADAYIPLIDHYQEPEERISTHALLGHPFFRADKPMIPLFLPQAPTPARFQHRTEMLNRAPTSAPKSSVKIDTRPQSRCSSAMLNTPLADKTANDERARVVKAPSSDIKGRVRVALSARPLRTIDANTLYLQKVQDRNAVKADSSLWAKLRSESAAGGGANRRRKG